MRALYRASSVPNTASCPQAFLGLGGVPAGENSAGGSAQRGAPAWPAVAGAGLFSWGLSQQT